MARPRSEEKRTLLLDAAASVIAERGPDAPTALISKIAGVAEGTLFTYFRTKEELLTELYSVLVKEAFGAVPRDMKTKGGSRQRLLRIWTGVFEWGLANPKRWAAIRVLGLSHLVDERHRHAVRSEGRRFLVDALGVPDSPPGFATSLFRAVLDVTMEHVRERPDLADSYKAAGFDALSKALSLR